MENENSENTSKHVDNTSKYIRLSYPLTEESAIHPDLLRVRITPKNQMSQGDAYNTSIITAENHSGTHVDGPAHFLKGGRPIFEYDPDELSFQKPVVLNCPKNPDELVNAEDVSHALERYENSIQHVDCVLIRTGFGKYHESDVEIYVRKNPGISPEAVFYLRKNLPELACIGIDVVSMSRFGRVKEAVDVHQTGSRTMEGFGKPLIFVEDLNLRTLQEDLKLEEVLVIPWQVGGIDSAPCTVLARVKSRD
jgi:kynurenine formamidase